jgi:hypothetical protein
MTESPEEERRRLLCEEMGISNEELNLFIGSKKQEKRDRWAMRKSQKKEWWEE